MGTRHVSGGLRNKVLSILSSYGDLQNILAELLSFPPKRLITPLISSFYQGVPELRWRAISVFGKVMAKLADEDTEAARIVMRRLMWSLNDESGGIGWGAPEAMAEAMVNHPVLAEEYARILLSYIREDGNFLEYDPLRKGALWGIARLAAKRPDLMKEYETARFVRPYLKDGDPEARAFAVLTLGVVGEREDCEALEGLVNDQSEITIYSEGKFSTTTLSEVALKAMASLCN